MGRRPRWHAVILAMALVVLVAGCAVSDGDGTGDGASGDGAAQDLAWLDTELTDAVTGDTIRISDFAGEPVLVQGFAVW